ncbi:hypothetical protein [Halocatena salina]|uniref:SHOCT domain-containing protein n=1 Tax=Halocatena salina TaxID=2934340 RepID=A0A8U0A4Q6_9EURY|nr:hypothetical protein [Halocatena salina]UPM44190.1 hypothetical protein MW046_14325 [Halocatena salina]
MQLRRLIEEYTPDGTLGRLGLAVATGSTGGFLLWAAAVGLFTGTALSTVLITPPAAIGFFVCAIITTLMIWPVYLSAIGRVDSPVDYASELRDQPSISPTEQIKDEYQTGNLSETDLERELEAVLEKSNRSQSKDHTQRSQNDQQLEELEND